MKLLIPLVCVLAALVPHTHAAVYSGTSLLEPNSFLVFIGKFVFDVDTSAQPPMHVSFNCTTKTPNQLFVLFDDQEDSWPAVWDNPDITCQEALDGARAIGGQKGIAVTVGGPFYTNVAINETLRPRVWYATIMNCKSPGVQMDSWTVTFLNAGKNQFGVNLFGVVPLYVIFFLAYIPFLAVYAWAQRSAYRTGSLHPIYHILSVTLLLEFSSILFFMIHFSVYGGNGVGVPFLEGVANLLDDFSSLLLLMLVILIAKGWTITFPQLAERRALLIVMAVLCILYFALFIWKTIGIDAQSTAYEWDSVPGILLVLARVACFFWFLWSLRATVKEENRADKRGFYIIFGTFYGFWFAALPIVVAIASLLNPWVRQKIVDGLTLTIHTVSMGVMVYLLWPSRAGEYFRVTTQGNSLAGSRPYDEI